MLAWGKKGFSDRIEHAMSMATTLAGRLSKEDRISLWAVPTTGVTVFRPLTMSTEELYKLLPEGMFSTCVLDEQKWLRSVAANPLADIDNIVATIQEAIQ
jgi:L-2,4-diaminobutyrate decarboxylase